MSLKHAVVCWLFGCRSFVLLRHGDPARPWSLDAVGVDDDVETIVCVRAYFRERTSLLGIERPKAP